MDQKKVEYYNHASKKRISWKFLIVLMLIVFGLVFVFTTFTSKGVITGKNVVDGLNFNAELSISPLELDNVFDKIEIRGSYNTDLNVGGEKFDLSKSNNIIILEDFEGKISTDGKNINLLKGNAKRILVNGVPIMPDATSLLSTKLEDFKFTSLDVTGGAYIESLSYNATGNINIEGTSLNIKNEVLNLEKFSGSLTIEENVMKLQGEIKSISTEGKSKISISI